MQINACTAEPVCGSGKGGRIMTGVICGTGACLPEEILSNDDIAEFADTSDQWIRERTGVEERRIARKETTAAMAAEAGRQALQEAGISPEEVHMIIMATATPDHIFPCGACEVQKELGAVHAVCFDMNAACSGFLFAYQTAQAYIASGIYRNILITGSERLSRIVDWKDRGTCILFGDGAGAVVIRAEEGQNYLPFSCSDGAGGAALTCPGVSEGSEPHISMDGREVFQFAVRRVPEAVREVLKRNDMKTEEIHWFILHQANRRIVEAAAKRLKTGIEKFPMNLQKYGNTSSASIPILLNQLNRSGSLKKGQKIVLAGFGAGLSWGASLLEWGI